MRSIYSFKQHLVFRSDNSQSAWEDSWEANRVFKPHFSRVPYNRQPSCTTICVLGYNFVLGFEIFYNSFQFSFTDFSFLYYHYVWSIFLESPFNLSLFSSTIEASSVLCCNNHFDNFRGCWMTSDNGTTLPELTSSSPTIWIDSFIILYLVSFPIFQGFLILSIVHLETLGALVVLW